MISRLKLTSIKTILRVIAPHSGFEVIGNHKPSDIFIVGFPKSGHTWCQYLLAGILCGLDTSRTPDSLVQDIVPDIYTRMTYRRHTEPVFFKSHALPRKEYRRVIYLLRDGRDAMVSWFHFYSALNPEVNFETMIEKACGLEARWHEHVEAWTRNPFSSEIIIVKYEELQAAPVEQLFKIANFAGLTVSEERVLAAVSNSTFEKQKQRERKMGWDDKNWPKGKPFIRRGVVGGYRDEMPPGALERFEKEAGTVLRKHGYT